MSTGHHHGAVSDGHRVELARISRLPWFRQGMAIPKVLIRASQIPWLGGSSTDLKRIYADPRFRGYAPYGKAKINARVLLPALIRHEVVEGILLVLGRDERGQRYSYDGAHEIATAAELETARRIIEGLGLRFSPAAYQAIYRPFLAVTEPGPWINLPPDLNMEPYRQDAPGLAKEMERQMLRGEVVRAAA